VLVYQKCVLIWVLAYRVYFTMREKIMVILLAGGTKSSQQTDIKKAIELAKEF